MPFLSFFHNVVVQHAVCSASDFSLALPALSSSYNCISAQTALIVGGGGGVIFFRPLGKRALEMQGSCGTMSSLRVWSLFSGNRVSLSPPVPSPAKPREREGRSPPRPSSRCSSVGKRTHPPLSSSSIPRVADQEANLRLKTTCYFYIFSSHTYIQPFLCSLVS